MNRPYHIQFPDYEERMRVISRNTLAWYNAMNEVVVFTLIPLSHH